MLTSTVRNWITGLAHAQWEDFIAYSVSPDQAVKGLLERTPGNMPNKMTVEFLKYAAQLQGAKDASVLLDSLPASDHHLKAVSWLARVQDRNGSDFVAVKLDLERLQGGQEGVVDGAPWQHVSRIVGASCLHEIGHVFMHWQQILGQRRGNAVWPSGTYEAQAWCFAFALLGMAAEQISMEFVENPEGLDHVWEFMAKGKF